MTERSYWKQTGKRVYGRCGVGVHRVSVESMRLVIVGEVACDGRRVAALGP